MPRLKVGDRITFEDGRGGQREGRLKAFNMSTIRAEVEVDGRTVDVDLKAILLVNGSPLQPGK